MLRLRLFRHLLRRLAIQHLQFSGIDLSAVFFLAIGFPARLPFGPNAGQRAVTLQTVPVITQPRKGSDLVTKQAGFSLHDGIACKSYQRKKLERLCRYITRPAIAARRLSLANNGNVVIALKTPYEDGTTHVVLSPMEFIGRLAVLVPRPGVNLTRFHGDSAKPRSRTRAPEAKRLFGEEGAAAQACVLY